MSAELANVLFLNIPQERVGVLIGKNGEVKRKIEEETGVKIQVHQDGTIRVEYNAEDPEAYFKVRRIADAIASGFSGEDALRLLDDNLVLKMIDLRDFAGESSSRIKIIKGRIIGKDGKVWKKIEKLSGAKLALHNYTLGVMGEEESCEIAFKTILKILKGAQFSTAFKYLERQRKSLEKGIWMSREEKAVDEF
ncbi:MAG: KH domain-containing protein [Candidatus Jordarchaeales archaeon]